MESEDQNAIGACGGGVRMEFVEAIDINRVQIREENDRDFRCGSDFSDGIKNTLDAGARIDGAGLVA